MFLLVLVLFGVDRLARGPCWRCRPPCWSGMAHATPIFAYAAWLERVTGFMLLFRLGVIPMFLFSGAFFPVVQLPDPLQWLAQVMPLYHGVELVRGLVLGTAEPGRRPAARRLPRRLAAGRLLAGRPDARPPAGRGAWRRRDPDASPVLPLLGRPAWHLVERNAVVYRRDWLVFVTGFLEPLLYLLSIGIGIEQLVGDFTLPDGQVGDLHRVRGAGDAGDRRP